MKLAIIALILGLSLLLFGCTQPNQPPGVCTKDGTALTMDENEALNIAQASECGQKGKLIPKFICNSGTGTWWIETDIKQEGCSPACVVDLESKTAEINWRCMGLATPIAEPTATPQPTSTEITVAAPIEIQMAQANNEFAFDFFSQVKDEPGNIFFSPFSMGEAFGMLYEGANGNTATELASVFGFEEDMQKRREGFLNLNNRLNAKKDAYKLSVANSIWIQQDYPVFESYKAVIKDYYGGDATNLDFIRKKQEAADAINNWCSEHTNGKIPKVIEAAGIDDSLALVLANAIYFKGNWLLEFDEDDTRDAEFRVSPTQKVRVPMMYSAEEDANFAYMENDDLQMLEIPYKGGDLSMLVLLPKADSLDGLEGKISAANLKEWESRLEAQTVLAYLPKFKMETEYDLVPLMQKLGVIDVFEYGPSDLSGIDGSRLLYVSFALQKAYVDVNEEGTEAAAVTVIGVVGAAMPIKQPPTFKADHPFIFIIQEKASGNILFMGRVANPLLGN